MHYFRSGFKNGSAGRRIGSAHYSKGPLAEWLGSALQKLLQRFESARDLLRPPKLQRRRSFHWLHRKQASKANGHLLPENSGAEKFQF